MKKFTQAEFDALPRDANGYKICPTGDYSGISFFPECSKFGAWSKFGAKSEFGAESEFGAWSKFGDSFYFKEKKFTKIFMMQNLDGSGRQIICLFGDSDPHINAGCFFGTVDEFCRKAQSENKMFYASVVKAACDAYAATLNQYKGE